MKKSKKDGKNACTTYRSCTPAFLKSMDTAKNKKSQHADIDIFDRIRHIALFYLPIRFGSG